MAWDKELIAEGVLAPDLNDEIRANWAALEAALTKEMNFSTGGTASLQGILKQGGARCFFQDTAPATRIDGSAFAATDNGSLWFDTNATIDNQFNFLSDYSGPTWTPVSNEIIAVLLASARTFAAAVTFDVAAILSKAPTLTEGIVANATYLQGRNEADDANTDMIQVGRNEADDTDVAQVPDEARLASNAAPTEDTQIANKKYVDDQDTADHPAYTGGESHIDGSGLITKMGVTGAVGIGATVTVTFGAAFPNGIVSALVSIKSTGVQDTPLIITASSASAISIKNNSGSFASDSVYWMAIGY